MHMPNTMRVMAEVLCNSWNSARVMTVARSAPPAMSPSVTHICAKVSKNGEAGNALNGASMANEKSPGVPTRQPGRYMRVELHREAHAKVAEL